MVEINSRNLKVLRTKYDLNQEDIAKELHISEQSYRSKENGRMPFWLTEARKIAILFTRLEKRTVSIEEIFFGNGVYAKETTTGN